MRTAVLFGGPQALDFLEVRSSIVRIPEVRIRLEEAQKIWDVNIEQVVDFHQFLCSDDKEFFSNSSLKSLCSAIVQVGLYERLIRHFRNPEFLVGDSRNDSSLLVATGRMSLSDLVLSSRAAGVVKPITAPIHGLPTLPVLNGQTFAMFEIYARELNNGVDQFASTQMREMDLNKIVRHLYEDRGVRQLITVGPGRTKLQLQHEGMLSEMQNLESIDLDPMLSWFWRDVQEVSVSA